VRAGDPKAIAAYQAHRRLQALHPALVAERVARHYAALRAEQRSVAITTARAATAREINCAIQARSRSWESGRGVDLRDGTRAFAGDQVATRRNDSALVSSRGAPVRNRQTWTVRAVRPDGSLVLADPERGQVTVPADYADKHLELGWAVTGYGTQGMTVDVGICVVEPTTSRAGLYVGMTRGRHTNVAFVLDEVGTADAAETLSSIIARPAKGLAAIAVRDQLHGQHLVDELPAIRKAREGLAMSGRSVGRRGPERPRGVEIG